MTFYKSTTLFNFRLGAIYIQIYDKLLQNKINFEKNTNLKKGTKKSLKNDATISGFHRIYNI